MLRFGTATNQDSSVTKRLLAGGEHGESNMSCVGTLRMYALNDLPSLHSMISLSACVHVS